MRRFALILLLSALLVAPVAAQEFSSLEERMSAADFRAAGLDKLSAEELARLNAWLRQNPTAGSAAALAAPRPGSSPRRGLFSDGGRVVSRLVGDYDGRSGQGTRFVLENGQVWESIDSGARLSPKPMTRPKVTIESGFLGANYLKLEGLNARISVRLVE